MPKILQHLKRCQLTTLLQIQDQRPLLTSPIIDHVSEESEVSVALDALMLVDFAVTDEAASRSAMDGAEWA